MSSGYYPVWKKSTEGKALEKIADDLESLLTDRYYPNHGKGPLSDPSCNDLVEDALADVAYQNDLYTAISLIRGCISKT